MKRGLLLFAHGARDPRWALPFEDVAQRIRAADASVPVALSYLEFMSPGLVEAGAQLAAQGCDRVEVVPLFLGAGGHVRKDLPALLDKLAQNTRFKRGGVPALLRGFCDTDDAIGKAVFP